MSNVGKHDAGGVCVNLKNSIYEVNEYCNILLLTLASIHSTAAVDGKLVNCEASCAQKSQLWVLKIGVFLYVIIDGSCGPNGWYFPLDVAQCGSQVEKYRHWFATASSAYIQTALPKFLQSKTCTSSTDATLFWQYVLSQTFDTAFSVASFLDSDVCWDC